MSVMWQSKEDMVDTAMVVPMAASGVLTTAAATADTAALTEVKSYLLLLVLRTK